MNVGGWATAGGRLTQRGDEQPPRQCPPGGSIRPPTGRSPPC